MTTAIGFAIVYPFAYLTLAHLASHFFAGTRATLNRKSWFSVLIIIILALATISLSNSVASDIWANRLQHAIGGGVVATFVTWFAIRDSNLKINRFQFLISALLIVTALGVLNELLEFFLQYYTDMVFSQTINDTWLDLVSNASGALLALIPLTIFWRPSSVIIEQ